MARLDIAGLTARQRTIGAVPDIDKGPARCLIGIQGKCRVHASIEERVVPNQRDVRRCSGGPATRPDPYVGDRDMGCTQKQRENASDPEAGNPKDLASHVPHPLTSKPITTLTEPTGVFLPCSTRLRFGVSRGPKVIGSSCFGTSRWPMRITADDRV